LLERRTEVRGIIAQESKMPISHPVEMTARKDRVLKRLYEAFNGRDVAEAQSLMHPQVVWANGLDGGYVHGREGVRDYWLKQWNALDSRAELLAVDHTSRNTASVDVHLTAVELGGEKLFDTVAKHSFEFEDGLIRRFETSALDER